MSSSLPRRPVAAVMIASLIASAGWAAEIVGETSRAPASSSSKSSTPARTGKGMLPDPALLDGSTQPPEKKNEQGMIGDFELPGDENVKNGKVGGQQQGGQQGGQNQGLQVQLPGLPMPTAGGGRQGQQSQQGPQMGKQGGGGQAGGEQAGQQGGQQSGQQSGQAGGAQGGDPSSNPAGGAGDPNAKAEGIQVASLGGEGSSQDAIAASEKPPPVAIGDSTMKINTAGANAGVVGGQQIGVNTQQHEKGTGSGGKGTGGATGGPNRTEKGRTMPAGL